MVRLFILTNENEVHILLNITVTKLSFAESIFIFSLLKLLPGSRARHFRCVPSVRHSKFMTINIKGFSDYNSDILFMNRFLPSHF